MNWIILVIEGGKEMENKKYNDEFRNRAVKMAKKGISISKTARHIGVSPQTLANWIKTDENKKKSYELKVTELEEEIKKYKENCESRKKQLKS